MNGVRIWQKGKVLLGAHLFLGVLGSYSKIIKRRQKKATKPINKGIQYFKKQAKL